MPPMVVDADPGEHSGTLPVMTLDQEALFRQSKWGQRMQAEMDRRGREIAAENERLANQFSAEEAQLTQLRQTLPAEEFRKRAEDFDKRVVEVRRARDAAARDFQAEIETERQDFFRAVLPVLAKLMRERGAVAVLDQRAIFVASQAIDVTDILVERIDTEMGEGPAPVVKDTTPADPPPEKAAPQNGTAPVKP